MRPRRRVQTVNDEPSRTIQSDINQADIHHIIDKFARTGIVDEMARVDSAFLDVSEFTDYADLRRQTADAEQQFLSLPSKLREVFDHDVYTWLDAAHDPEKLDALRPKLEKLGLSFLAPKEKPASVQMDPAPVEGPGSPSPQGNTPAAE